MTDRPFDWEQDCPKDVGEVEVDAALQAAGDRFSMALAAHRAGKLTDEAIRKGLNLP